MRNNVILTLAFFLMASPAYAIQEPLAAENAREISDRNYFKELRRLIATATESIDVSMDQIYITADPADPVGFLLEDLVKARKRNVAVRIFLNTSPAMNSEQSLFLRADQLEYLRQQNIEVHFVNPDYELHDRLVIFDLEWILEGGLSWTHQELERGLGSATLAQSKEIARRKKIRLELLPLWDVASQRAERSEGRISVPLYLLKQQAYFPAMVLNDDGDAIRLYLGLLRIFETAKKRQLNSTYEDLAREIPAERVLEPSAANFHVLKTLERLAKDYHLIQLDKKEADRAEFTMQLPEQIDQVVGVPILFFMENYVKELSPAAIYAYFVILYRSQISGESPVWLGSAHNVEQDFPLESSKFLGAVDELRRQNMIEIFPFHLTEEPGPISNLEYRYLINPLASLSEKVQMWTRLRDQFGDEDLKRARQAADAFGEPEDPKVVAVYLQLLKEFPFEDVLALTQQFETLAPESTPSRLEYLRTRLEHESKPLKLAT